MGLAEGLTQFKLKARKCANLCKNVLFFLTKHPSNTLTQVLMIRRRELTAVQVAGDGGMGEEEVVEVGVLLEWRYISSSTLP